MGCDVYIKWMERIQTINGGKKICRTITFQGRKYLKRKVIVTFMLLNDVNYVHTCDTIVLQTPMHKPTLLRLSPNKKLIDD